MTKRVSDCCGALEHLFRPGTCVTCGEHTSFGAKEEAVTDTTLTDGDLGILRRERVGKNADTLAELDALLREVQKRLVYARRDVSILPAATVEGGLDSAAGLLARASEMVAELRGGAS